MNDEQSLERLYQSVIFGFQPEYSSAYYDALAALSMRINPDSNHQYGWWEYIAPENFDKRCLICGEAMGKTTNRDWRIEGEHGMDHLKERNLLPFI